MSAFLYYRPGPARVGTLDAASELGLRYAFERPPTCCGTQKGPDGETGYTFTQGDSPGYYEKRQEWAQIPGSQCWVGYYKDQRPTPADLARREQIDGHFVECELGQKWLIPTARRFVEEGDQLVTSLNLPSRFRLQSDGRWAADGVMLRYQPLWELACAYEQAEADAVNAAADGQEEIYFTFDAFDELAVLALQTNYRLAAAELDLLGIYNQQFRQQIVNALIDRPTWQAWAQKKIASDQNGSPSASGQPQPSTEETPDTPPRSPKSKRSPPAITTADKG